MGTPHRKHSHAASQYDQITLTDRNAEHSTAWSAPGEPSNDSSCGPALCWSPPTGNPIPGSLRPWVCEDTARKWRHRWCQAPGLASLATRNGRSAPGFHAGADRPGQGSRPAARGRGRVAAVKVVVSGTGRPGRHQAGSASRSRPATVRRWLTQDAIKPWQYQSWIFITDPDFKVKAQRARPLRPGLGCKTVGHNEYVISADEKTSIQARCRCHPTLPPGVPG